MKKALSEIAQDLEQGTINETEARTLLLELLGVNYSYYQVVHDTRKLGMQEITGAIPDLDSAKKALQYNKLWFDDMYIIARINCD